MYMSGENVNNLFPNPLFDDYKIYLFYRRSHQKEYGQNLVEGSVVSTILYSPKCYMDPITPRIYYKTPNGTL